MFSYRKNGFKTILSEILSRLLLFPWSSDNVVKPVMASQYPQMISAVGNLFPSFLSLSTFIKSGVNQLQPKGQIWPIPSFWVACELRVVAHLPLLDS